MVKLTNLNDIYGFSIAIFTIRIIFGSIEFIYISDILCTVAVGIGANRRENCIVVSYTILTDEIFAFLISCMNCEAGLIKISMFYNAIRFKHSNILHISAFISIFNKNSIGFLLFVHNSVQNNNDTNIINDSSWCFNTNTKVDINYSVKHRNMIV